MFYSRYSFATYGLSRFGSAVTAGARGRYYPAAGLPRDYARLQLHILAGFFPTTQKPPHRAVRSTTAFGERASRLALGLRPAAGGPLNGSVAERARSWGLGTGRRKGGAVASRPAAGAAPAS